jgi:hypothetical protein
MKNAAKIFLSDGGGYVQVYLRQTFSYLEISCFCPDPWVRERDEFKARFDHIGMQDISFGRECRRVPCVNSIDTSYPPYIGESMFYHIILFPNDLLYILNSKGKTRKIEV